MIVDWRWFAAWIALWVMLILAAEIFPGAAGVIGIFAGGVSLTVLGEMLYNGKLKAGLDKLGVPF